MPDRRTFLAHAARGAVGLAGAAAVGGGALGGCSSGNGHAGRPGQPQRATTGPKRPAVGRPLTSLPASSSPIDHVVVVMMENRSFDHWLGWLGTDHAWLDAGRSRYARSFKVAARQHQSFPGPTGPVATAHWTKVAGEPSPYRGCGHPDPGHNWTQGRAQRDGGFLAPGSGNDAFALGYYDAPDIPFTAALARRFTICDQSHASVLGPTFPNRLYLHSAQSGEVMTNAFPPQGGYQWTTIWEKLKAANVPAGYYATDFPITALFAPTRVPAYKKVDDFMAECAAGTLPPFSMVDPGFVGDFRTDDHPHGDIHAGERFVRDVFAAFARSPHWTHGLFVLTFDEWGGFFDHVRPARFADDRLSANDLQNFGQGGFRVPTILASPYAQRGFVDHTLYDHSSILRFIEWRFLGAPPEGAGQPGPGAAPWALTERDANAQNVGRSLVTRPDPDIGFDLDVAVPAPSPGCPGPPESLAWRPGQRGVEGAMPVARHEDQGEVSIADLVTSGWLDRRGIDFEPSAMARGWVV